MIEEKLKALSTRTKVLLGVLGVVCGIACISVLVNWYTPAVTPPQTYTQAPPIPALKSVPKIDIAIPKVKVYQKDIIIKKLPDLPSEIKDNPAIEVTGSATTGASKVGYNIVSSIDKNTGETSIYYREKERKLIEFISEKRVGVAYGISTDKGQQLGKVYGEWAFLRVADAHLSLQTEIRAKQAQQVEAIGMISIDYRW